MKPSFREPYLGLTGVNTPAQAEKAVDIFREHGFIPGSGRNGMIGVLASAHTVPGLHPGSKSNRHAPNMDILADTLEAVGNRAKPMMHVEIDKQLGNVTPFAAPLARLLAHRDLYGRNLCRAVQLNGHPYVDELKVLKRDFPDLEVVFQVRKELMRMGSDSVLTELGIHPKAAFAHALIDPSAGTGTEFDIDAATELYAKLRAVRPDLQPGFAGGFSPHNTRDRVMLLRQATGNADWHIDVEGKVRDPRTDDLDMQLVDGYAEAAAAGFMAPVRKID